MSRGHYPAGPNTYSGSYSSQPLRDNLNRQKRWRRTVWWGRNWRDRERKSSSRQEMSTGSIPGCGRSSLMRGLRAIELPGESLSKPLRETVETREASVQTDAKPAERSTIDEACNQDCIALESMPITTREIAMQTDDTDLNPVSLEKADTASGEDKPFVPIDPKSTEEQPVERDEMSNEQRRTQEVIETKVQNRRTSALYQDALQDKILDYFRSGGSISEMNPTYRRLVAQHPGISGREMTIRIRKAYICVASVAEIVASLDRKC
jgi:hypothetical protein